VLVVEHAELTKSRDGRPMVFAAGGAWTKPESRPAFLRNFRIAGGKS
jgi:hypothetical protein